MRSTLSLRDRKDSILDIAKKKQKVYFSERFKNRVSIVCLIILIGVALGGIASSFLLSSPGFLINTFLFKDSITELEPAILTLRNKDSTVWFNGSFQLDIKGTTTSLIPISVKVFSASLYYAPAQPKLRNEKDDDKLLSSLEHGACQLSLPPFDMNNKDVAFICYNFKAFSRMEFKTGKQANHIITSVKLHANLTNSENKQTSELLENIHRDCEMLGILMFHLVLDALDIEHFFFAMLIEHSQAASFALPCTATY